MNKMSLVIDKDDSINNDFLYAWNAFDKRPNEVIIHNSYLTEDLEKILDDYIVYENVLTDITATEEPLMISEKMFLRLSSPSDLKEENKKRGLWKKRKNDDELTENAQNDVYKNNVFCSYFVSDRNREDSYITDIEFFYKEKEDLDFINEVIDKLNNALITFDNTNVSKLSSITINTQGEFELEYIDSNMDNIDIIQNYYSKNTYTNIICMIKNIKNNNRGLSILYGDKGLGKSSMIKYLSNNLDRIVIYIPLNMVDKTFNNSEFKKFIKRFVKPIVVIDDCEKLNDCFITSNLIINNILQMVDGFLSSTFNINVIMIYNTNSISNIDSELKNSNGLINFVPFGRLSIKEAKLLCEKINKNLTITKEMPLIDIIKPNRHIDCEEIDKQFGF